jgi:nucleotide-binding universal stress UspA family protein
MVIKRILVPFDISEYSLDASKEAIELAESFGASVTFIHIVEPEPSSDCSTTGKQLTDRLKMK